jgi:hypothetical protein
MDVAIDFDAQVRTSDIEVDDEPIQQNLLPARVKTEGVVTRAVP